MRAAPWVVALILVCACGPSRATRTAIDEANRLGAECEAHAAAIAEAAPSLEVGREQLAAERLRCAALGCTYCAAHHLDCTSLGLVCTEAP